MSIKAANAHQYWCPYSRVNQELIFPPSSPEEADDDLGFRRHMVVLNRVATGPKNIAIPPGAHCMGPICMAWRNTATQIEEPEGYCGAFGPPTEHRIMVPR